MSAHERVFNLYGLGENADGSQVRGTQLPLQAGVLQRGSGVVSHGQQDLVVIIFEAVGVVGADDYAAELVLKVDRDGDEVVYLVVRRRAFPSSLGLLLPHRAVALQHLVREALHDGALFGVVLEAFSGEEVELPVAVRVLPREQQTLLRPDQRLREAKHQGGHVARVAQGSPLARETHDLPVQLLAPIPLRLLGALGALAHVAFAAKLMLVVFQPLFEPSPLVLVGLLALFRGAQVAAGLAELLIALAEIVLQALAFAPGGLLYLRPPREVPPPAEQRCDARYTEGEKRQDAAEVGELHTDHDRHEGIYRGRHEQSHGDPEPRFPGAHALFCFH